MKIEKPQDVEKLFANVYASMSTKLDICRQAAVRGLTDKAYYHEALLVKRQKTITVKESDDIPVKLKELYRKSHITRGIGKTIKMVGHTRPVGRFDYFDRIEFKIVWYELAQSNNSQIHDYARSTVKDILNKVLKPKGAYNFTVDCQLMKLFMAGKITIDDVVKGSQESCEVY